MLAELGRRPGGGKGRHGGGLVRERDKVKGIGGQEKG